MKIKSIDRFATVVKGSAKDGRLTAVASDETIDRDGEIILASAWLQDLDYFKNNPVILAAHTHRSSDGTPTIVGSADTIGVKDDQLVFDMRFAGIPLALQWRQLYEEGHAKSFSVGFLPLAGEFREIKCNADERRRRRDVTATETQTVYVHTRVELLEISCVAVPANPEATARDMDPHELERLIDQRIRKALQETYVQRLTAILG